MRAWRRAMRRWWGRLHERAWRLDEGALPPPDDELGIEVQLLLREPPPRDASPRWSSIRRMMGPVVGGILTSPVSRREQARAIRHLRLALAAATGASSLREPPTAGTATDPPALRSVERVRLAHGPGSPPRSRT